MFHGGVGGAVTRSSVVMVVVVGGIPLRCVGSGPLQWARGIVG